MTNLDSILKSRDITLPTKVCLVKAVVFPVVTYAHIKPYQRICLPAISKIVGSTSHTILDNILKSKDITLPTKVHLVKAMVFPVSCMDVRVGL